MKGKRFLSLFVAVLLCLSSFTVFAEDVAEEIIITAEETVVIPEEEQEEKEGKVDYSDMSNWAYWNEGEDKQADLFFVCPTVDMGKAGNFVADISNEKYRSSFVGATNMELGIYNGVSRVYAPYFRQGTFPVYSLSEEEREEYLDFAYQDVKDAFIYYFNNLLCNDKRNFQR